MSFLTNMFVLGSYVIVALALALGLQAFAGVPPVVGWLAAAILFLFAGQVHGALNRAQENAGLSAEIETLRAALAAAERDLGSMALRLDQAEGQLTGIGDLRRWRLAAEMKVLENLVQEFAGSIVERTATAQRIASSEGTGASDEAPNEAWKVAGFDASNPSAFDRATKDQLITAIRDSLAENRVELYLQPIVSLPQRRLRFYEALTRLRTDSGEILMPRHYLRVAEAAGLVSTIDNLLLFRSVQIVRMLMEENSDELVFCNISARSLQDENFFRVFLDFLEGNTALARRLVFEFAQDALDICGPLELSSLRRLAGLGFRFSMDQVSAIDFDAGSLRDRGFRYVKVPAALIARRGRAAPGMTGIAEIKENLARRGIDLVAEKIEDDATVNAIVAAGVDFGQGYLLGEPRPAAEEPLTAQSTGAAA